MIGDLLSNTAQAQKLDIAQLQRAIQDGTLPSYVGLPLLQEKLKQRNEAAALLGGQKKPPTVKDQIMSSADQVTQAPEESEIPIPQGAADVQEGQDITALRSNLPGQYAGGGIIAFADRGEVELPEGGDYPEEEEEEEGMGRVVGPKSIPISSNWTPQGSFNGQDARTSVANFLRSQGLGDADKPPVIAKPVIPKGGTFGGQDARAATTDFLKSQGLGEEPGLPAKTVPEPITVSRDAKVAARPAVAPATARAEPEAARMAEEFPTTKLDLPDLKEMQDQVHSDREGIRQLILGSDDSDNKLKQRALLAMMEGGFKTAAGTSPYAAVNIGAGGAEGVKSFGEGIAQIDADKRSKISQLVNLGLKGEELDQMAAKMGLTKADIEAHMPLLREEAFYKHAAGMNQLADIQDQARRTNIMANRAVAGKSAGIDQLKMLQKFGVHLPASTELQLQKDFQTGLNNPDPSSPAFRMLDKKTQGVLTSGDYDPDSPAVATAMGEWNKAHTKYANDSRSQLISRLQKQLPGTPPAQYSYP